ncbi:hypothetical protein Tco_1222550 [Tanacetum coccineum]
MFPKESNELEKYVGRFPDMIQGSVMASKLKTMLDAIKFGNDLMDKKIRTFAERQAKNKRNIDDNTKNNQTTLNYSLTKGKMQCAPMFSNCKKVGHLAYDCRSQAATANN